jgi:7-cyano-7-deazaguanine synthase
MKKKAIVLVSGGMDSTTLLALRMRDGWELEALSFRYGSLHMDAESSCAEAVCRYYGISRVVLELPRFHGSALMGDKPLPTGRRVSEMDAGGVAPSYVPARNSVLLSLAASVADARGVDTICYGAHAGDHVGYPDCRPEFVAAISEALRLGTVAGVTVDAPFIGLQKSEIVRLGLSLGAPLDITHSCYRGHSPACGTCDTCILRQAAFADAGAVDPIGYVTA